MLTLVGLGFVACNRDESTNQPLSLVGTWKIAGYKAYDGKDEKTMLPTPSLDECEAKTNFVFRADGSFIENAYELKSGQCDYLGESIGSYKYDSSTKTLTLDDNEVKILRNTATEVEFIDEEHDVNNDGVEDIITMILKKQ